MSRITFKSEKSVVAFLDDWYTSLFHIENENYVPITGFEEHASNLDHAISVYYNRVEGFGLETIIANVEYDEQGILSSLIF